MAELKFLTPPTDMLLKRIISLKYKRLTRNDTVHGDLGDNRFYSCGGTDTFMEAPAKDVFTLSKRSYDNGLEHKIIIEDYQSGEEIEAEAPRLLRQL